MLYAVIASILLLFLLLVPYHMNKTNAYFKVIIAMVIVFCMMERFIMNKNLFGFEVMNVAI